MLRGLRFGVGFGLPSWRRSPERGYGWTRSTDLHTNDDGHGLGGRGYKQGLKPDLKLAAWGWGLGAREDEFLFPKDPSPGRGG